MSEAIQDLKHEHNLIVWGLRVLDKMDEMIADGQTVPPADMAALLGFLKEFADKCHHGKEEGLLFVELARAGMPEDSGPVAVLREDHAEGRALIRRMTAAVDGGPDYEAFAEAGREYSALLRRHIREETQGVFQSAEKALSAEQLASLYEEFERYEEEVIGPGRHAQLEATLDDLKDRYIVKL